MSVLTQTIKSNRKLLGSHLEVDRSDPFFAKLLFAACTSDNSGSLNLLNKDDIFTFDDGGSLGAVAAQTPHYVTGGPRGEGFLRCAPQNNIVNAPRIYITAPRSQLKPTDVVTVHWAGFITGDMPGTAQNNPSLVGCGAGYGILRKTNNGGNVGNTNLYYITGIGGVFNQLLTATSAISAYNTYASATFCIKSGSQLGYYNGVQVVSASAAGAISYEPGANAYDRFYINTDFPAISEQAQANFYAIYVWNRFLTVGEIQRLHRNPYAPLRATKRAYSFISFNPPAATPLTESVSDTISLSDVIGSGQGSIFSDTITLADLIDIGYSQNNQNVNDTLSLSDSSTLLEPGFWNTSDTITLGDSFQLFVPLGLSFADTLTLAENFQLLLGFLQSFADSLSLSDSIAFGNIIKQVVVDNILLTEFAKYFLASNIFNDTVILQDSLLMFLTIAFGLSDTISLSDSQILNNSLNIRVNIFLGGWQTLYPLAGGGTIFNSGSDIPPYGIALSDSTTISILQAITSYIRRYLNDVIGS